jgi:hypothetical protein
LIHGAERTANAFAERGDDCDTSDHDERGHDGVLNGRRAVFTGYETKDRGK